jgi:hypothetical protein
MANINIFPKININSETLTEKDVLFISGAGISAANPTKFALGSELHELILQTFTNLNKSQIDNYLSKSFALEETCQVIIDQFEIKNCNLKTGENLGWHILSELFSFNNFNTRNDYHCYFRNHLINGGYHITANIDQLIESSSPELTKYFSVITSNQIEELEFSNGKFNETPRILYKFHGDINSDPVGAQGFLKNIIEKGFDAKVKKYWKELINKVPLVIFIGYGGVDKFDVQPFFEGLNSEEFINTKAIWIDYGKNLKIEIQTDNEISRLYLSRFTSQLSIKCSPEVILNQLFDRKYKIISAHRIPNKTNPRIKKFLQTNVDKLINKNMLKKLSESFSIKI